MVGNITLSLMVGKPAIRRFGAIEKRRISTTLIKGGLRLLDLLFYSQSAISTSIFITRLFTSG